MGLYKRWSFKRVAGTKKGLYREQVENDYMQFPSWKWVQCGHQQGAQNIEELNLRFQLWSFDWKRFSVFNLRSQEPMTSVFTVLISGSRSSGWVAHSFARERTDQEDPRTALKILSSAFTEIQHDSARIWLSPQTLYPIKVQFHFPCGNTTNLYIDLKEMFIYIKISNANVIKFVLLTFLMFNRFSWWNRDILAQRWSIFGFHCK